MIYKINQIICSMLLIVVPAVHAANYDELKLQSGMFGTPGYPALSRGTLLTTANLDKPFFQWLKKQTPEEKQRILIIAKRMPIRDCPMKRDYWPMKRSNIAAMLKIVGADPKWAQEDGYFLTQAVDENDFALVHLMLKKGVDMSEKGTMFKENVLYFAKTKEMAKLLIQYKALEDHNISRLLHVVMKDEEYEIDLVPYYAGLYIQNKISFLTQRGMFEGTILTDALSSIKLRWTGPEIIKKITLLLATIPVVDGIALINAKSVAFTYGSCSNGKGIIIFEAINNALASIYGLEYQQEKQKKLIESFRDLLKDYAKDPYKYYKGLQEVESKQEADCLICLESLDDVKAKDCQLCRGEKNNNV